MVRRTAAQNRICASERSCLWRFVTTSYMKAAVTAVFHTVLPDLSLILVFRTDSLYVHTYIRKFKPKHIFYRILYIADQIIRNG